MSGNGLAGIPKDTVTFYDPVDAEQVQMVRVSAIERKLIASIPNNTARVALTDPGAATTIASNFQDRDQPFPEKDRIEVIKTDIIPLRQMNEREMSRLMVGELERAVSSTRLDNRTILDICHSRAGGEVSQSLGVGAVVEKSVHMGNQGVADVAGSPPFILVGGEEFIAALVAQTGLNFVAEDVDPLDGLRARIGIPILFRVSGFKLAKVGSADANAGRSASIPVQRPGVIPTALARQMPMQR